MSLDIGGVISQMEVVSLTILLGYALNRLDMMDETFDLKLTSLVLNVTLPCTVLSSLSSASDVPDRASVLLLMAQMSLAMLVAWGIAAVMARLLRVPRDVEGAYRFAMMFGNAGFIGFPVISSILCPDALLLAVLASIPGNVFMFTVGASMFSRRRGSSNAVGPRAMLGGLLASLRTPTTLASLAALACTLIGVSDFGIVGDAMFVVGQMSTPSALLIVGSSLARYNPLDMIDNPKAYAAAAFRLLGIPLASLLALRLLGAESLAAAVIVLECAMPVATNGTLFCVQSGMDATPMMQVTFLSIAGSIATVPLVALLLGM